MATIPIYDLLYEIEVVGPVSLAAAVVAIVVVVAVVTFLASVTVVLVVVVVLEVSAVAVLVVIVIQLLEGLPESHVPRHLLVLEIQLFLHFHYSISHLLQDCISGIHCRCCCI